MGFWSDVGDALTKIGNSPSYWYDTGFNHGKSGERRQKVYGGNVIDELPRELRDAYHRGYDDGVRERD